MTKRKEFVNDLSLEARFLVNILCEHLHQRAIPEIPIGINWKIFLTLCYSSHYAGIISDLFKTYDVREIPNEVSKSLKSYQLRVLTSNERLFHQYALLEQLADEQKLTLYPLKGITLMPKCYEKSYHRHISDIDVLIDQNDLKKWEELLQTHGFKTKRRLAKSLFHERMHLKYDPLQALKQQTVIDFHVNLNSGFHHIDIPVYSLQKNQKRDHELKEIDHLIFVCLHAFKHLYYGQLNLLHLMDIFLLSKEISFTELFARCEYFNCYKEVEQTINISLFFFGENERSITDWQQSVLENALLSKKINRSKKYLFFYRRHLQIPVPWHLSPYYLWSQVFPSADYLKQCDGSNIYAVNWLRRMLRLITNR